MKCLMCFKYGFCVDISHQVLLQKSEVESMVHSPGDYILLSADKYEIKVMLLSPVVSLVKKYSHLKLILSCVSCDT